MGTIAEKLNYSINATNDIADGINYLGGNITSDTELADFKDELDSVYNKLPKVSNSTASSSVTLNPTLKGRIDSTLKGQIGQDTTNGNQLLDYINNLNTNTSGLVSTINEDGSITTTGKPTIDYATLINYDITDFLENGATYYISQQTLQSNLYLQVNIVDRATSQRTLCSLDNSTSNSFIADTINKIYRMKLQTKTMESWGSSNRTITNFYQLEKGNSATDFEEYTGGIPSPNPNYEQPVKSVTGENTVRVKSAQLIDFESQTATGYSFTNDTLVYESSQRAYANVYWIITNLVKNNPGKKLYFSYEDIDVSNQVNVIAQINIGYNDGTANKYIALLNHDLSHSLYTIPNDTSNISYVNFGIFSNNSANNTNDYSVTIVKPQLQFGETELPYSEYGTPQEKELDLESENIFDRNNSTESKYLSAYTGSLSDSSASDTSDYISIDSKGLYLNYDFTTLLASNNRNLCYYDENKSFISGITYNIQDKKIKVDYVQNSKYIRFTYDKNLTDIKVYKEKYELYENGYFSRENGKWYLNNEYAKVINPSSVWNNVEQSGIYYRIPLDGLSIKSIGAIRQADVLCNKFRASTTNDYNICFHYSNRIFFYLPEGMTTKEEFLTLVSGMYIVYPLATPSKTEIINTTLINQLEEIYKLMSYDGTTIIETECEEGNLPIIISASALKGE